MRKIASVKIPNANAIRLMIYDKGPNDGVFVFGYDSKEDSSCSWDCHYNELDDAYEMGEDYGIQKEDWKEIDIPYENCQEDWISPVRVKGRLNGNPAWGKLERLVDGKWIEL